MLNSSDRRRAPRFRLSIPVEFEHDGNGNTRDVSTSGVFFETAQAVAPGAPIRFSLFFEEAYSDSRLRLSCEGYVVRVEQRAGRVGVAATITAFQFDPDTRPGG